MNGVSSETSPTLQRVLSLLQRTQHSPAADFVPTTVEGPHRQERSLFPNAQQTFKTSFCNHSLYGKENNPHSVGAGSRGARAPIDFFAHPAPAQACPEPPSFVAAHFPEHRKPDSQLMQPLHQPGSVQWARANADASLQPVFSSFYASHPHPNSLKEPSWGPACIEGGASWYATDAGASAPASPPSLPPPQQLHVPAAQGPPPARATKPMYDFIGQPGGSRQVAGPVSEPGHPRANASPGAFSLALQAGNCQQPRSREAQAQAASRAGGSSFAVSRNEWHEHDSASPSTPTRAPPHRAEWQRVVDIDRCAGGRADAPYAPTDVRSQAWLSMHSGLDAAPESPLALGPCTHSATFATGSVASEVDCARLPVPAPLSRLKNQAVANSSANQWVPSQEPLTPLAASRTLQALYADENHNNNNNNNHVHPGFESRSQDALAQEGSALTAPATHKACSDSQAPPQSPARGVGRGADLSAGYVYVSTPSRKSSPQTSTSRRSPGGSAGESCLGGNGAGRGERRAEVLARSAEGCGASLLELREDLEDLRLDVALMLGEAMHLTKQAVCAVKLIEKSTSAVAPASVAAPATSASKSKLRVCCRIYPAPSPGGIRIEDNYTIQVNDAERTVRSTFDCVIGPMARTEEVVRGAADGMVERVFGKSRNAAVVVCGAAGSGKTTLLHGLGTGGRAGANTDNDRRGLMSHLVEEVFQEVQMCKSTDDAAYTVYVTAMEMSQSGIHDLLSPNRKAGTQHSVLMDSQKCTYVTDLMAVEISSLADFEQIVRLLAKRRHTSNAPGTSLPHHPPEVHCVVTLLLDSGRSGCQVQNTSKLVFVELASAYMDEEDGRFVKGGGIADAVRALSQGGALPAAFGSKRAHVLEQYLKDTFDPRSSSELALIMCMHPHEEHAAVNLSSAAFASRILGENVETTHAKEVVDLNATQA